MNTRKLVKQLLGQLPLAANAGSRLRAYQQEKAALRYRNQIEAEAARLNLSALSTSDTVTALRTRLAKRSRKHAWPKPKGNLHLFVAFRLFDWEAVLLEAFKPFGDVTIFEWSSAGFDLDGPDWWENRAVMNRAMLTAFTVANARQPVDAVVGYLSGHNTDPATLTQMKAAGAAVFNFSYDDKLDVGPRLPDGTQRGPAGLAAAVDLTLSSDPGATLKYAIEGGLSHFHPECAEPQTHRPLNTPFDFDVSFVGACYGARPHFIQSLERKGISVVTMGRGWPSGAVPTERMVEMYSRSRINLGFGGIGHSRKLMCLKGRDFEVPMAGGLYLTQDNPELAQVFDIGREIVTYTDDADCVAQIRLLLTEPERAAAIRAAGHARCLRDHTFEARWTQVFMMAGIL